MRLGAVMLRQCCVPHVNLCSQVVAAFPVHRRHSGTRGGAATCRDSSSLPKRHQGGSSSGSWVVRAAAGPRQQPGPQQRRYSNSSNAVLSNTTSFLRNLHNGAEIFLVGTAHVSKKSADEVREMIRLVKPDVVMVELCPERAARLCTGTSDQDFLKQMLGSLFAPGGSLSQKLVQASLPMMYRGLKMLGMDPGGEFKVALEEAERIGARVVYGDRNAQRTMQRLSQAVDLPTMLRMMSGSGLPEPPPLLAEFFARPGGLESQVEGMKTRAMVREMAAYMRQVNPRLATALIDERDQIMVDSLAGLQGRVVGVVGLAHLDGMERRWEQLQYSKKALAR